MARPDHRPVVVDIGAGAVLGRRGDLVGREEIRRAADRDHRAFQPRLCQQCLGFRHEALNRHRPAWRRIGHQPAEGQAPSRRDLLRQSRSGFGRLHPAALAAGVAFHEHIQRGIHAEGRGKPRDHLRAVVRHRQPRDTAGQRLQPRQPGRAQDIIGDQDVVEPGLGKDLGFRHLLAIDPHRPGVQLGTGDLGQLVRLDMGPEGAAQPVHIGLRPGDIGGHPHRVDHGQRGQHLIQRRAWGRPDVIRAGHQWPPYGR